MTGTQIPTPVLEEYRLLLEQKKPGAAIKLMREELGITIDQIHKETLIPEWKLSDLENEVYEGLGGTIFVMGYMRKIARIIDVDPDPLITAYGRDPSRTQEGEPVLLDPEAQKAAKAAAASDRKNRKHKKPLGRRLPGPIAIGVLLLIWVAAVLWMKTDSDDGVSEKAVEQPSAEVSVAKAGDAENTGDSASDADDEQAPEVADIDIDASAVGDESTEAADTSEQRGESQTGNSQPENSESVVVVPVSDEAVTEEAPVQGSDGEQLISVLFSQDCWIQVTDATGKVLFAELQRTGDNLRLFGQAPFSVMLGNARAATISYNGETVDFAPAPGRDTLRLTVGD